MTYTNEPRLEEEISDLRDELELAQDVAARCLLILEPLNEPGKPNTLIALVERAMQTITEHAECIGELEYAAENKQLRDELRRLCGPICPFDGKRAVEHALSPTRGNIGLRGYACTWHDSRHTRCGLPYMGHDARVGEAIRKDWSAPPSHGYESVAAHVGWPEGAEWLAKRNEQ